MHVLNKEPTIFEQMYNLIYQQLFKFQRIPRKRGNNTIHTSVLLSEPERKYIPRIEHIFMNKKDNLQQQINCIVFFKTDNCTFRFFPFHNLTDTAPLPAPHSSISSTESKGIELTRLLTQVGESGVTDPVSLKCWTY